MCWLVALPTGLQMMTTMVPCWSGLRESLDAQRQKEVHSAEMRVIGPVWNLVGGATPNLDGSELELDWPLLFYCGTEVLFHCGFM